VVLIGRMVRDPEMRTTTTGKNVVSFSIAVNKRVKPKDGEPDADFFRVTAWGQTAEYVNSYLTKGRLVAVDGRLESRKWTDQSGANRESIEVVADNVNGLDRPRDDAGSGSGGAYGNAPAAPKSVAPAVAEDDYDPFADE
jgi:single-strand DNA-binding protein